MALETGTYISSLVATNPTATDPVSQADDHLRFIKSTLLATFPNVTGAVTATHTQINTVATQPITLAAFVASTAGTAINFTSIPSWVKKITVVLNGVSTSGTSNPIVQIGDSGGIETAGYLGSASQQPNGAVPIAANYTTGFGITGAVAATTVLHGNMVIALLDASTNTWVASVSGGQSNTAATFVGGGSKALSATLDRVRITTEGGTDTFDAGNITVIFE